MKQRTGSLIAIVVMVVIAAGCGRSSGSSAGDAFQITGHAMAGPVCPVEHVPPDPDCAPRPVVGALLIVVDEAGSEVARVATEQDGSFSVRVPAGRYVVRPGPVDGLLGTPPSQPVVVGPPATAVLEFSYDTGIR